MVVQHDNRWIGKLAVLLIGIMILFGILLAYWWRNQPNNNLVGEPNENTNIETPPPSEPSQQEETEYLASLTTLVEDEHIESICAQLIEEQLSPLQQAEDFQEIRINALGSLQNTTNTHTEQNRSLIFGTIFTISLITIAIFIGWIKVSIQNQNTKKRLQAQQAKINSLQTQIHTLKKQQAALNPPIRWDPPVKTKPSINMDLRG